MSPGQNRRFELTVQYDGADFHGWQVQPALRTVQGELESVLGRITEGDRAVVGSGRTDTGVHATGQVAAVDVPARWKAERLQSALNALLPRDIWVERVRDVPDRFHPRYDAVARTYEYRVGLEPRAFSPFHRPFCWAIRATVDPEVLAEAATLLRGEHSFRAFAKAGQEARGDRCSIHTARWAPWDGMGLIFTVTADRYLHHMVRYLVGTMVDVGRRRRSLEELGSLLEDAGGDLETSPPAPPQGLYLARVEYPPEAYGQESASQPDSRSPSES